MVVVMAIGLSLVLITQTEMLIGTNDQIIQRVFYAADSGIAMSTGRALVVADHRPRTYVIEDPESPLNLVHEVQVSAFYPILEGPCNLCEINDVGTYSERSYRKINHGVTVLAERKRAPGSATTDAAKRVSAMVEIQPWKLEPSAYAAINDEEQLGKILF